MANTYQANYFTGQQLDDHMAKVLDKSFAGQGLELDENGVLHNTTPGYGVLVKTYVHTINKEAHPEAIDLTTGYFTVPSHGFTDNQKVFAAVNEPYHLSQPYQYLPKGLLLGGVPSRTAQIYYIRLIDSNTFGLSTEKDGTIQTYTQRSTMDLTKFHFEQYRQIALKLDGLPDLTDALIVIEGRYAHACRFVETNGRINDSGYYGFVEFDDNNDPGSRLGDSWIGAQGGWGSVYATIEFKRIGANHLLQTKIEDTLCFTENNMGTAYHSRSYIHRAMETGTFNEIQLHTYNALFNGTTVRVYAKA